MASEDFSFDSSYFLSAPPSPFHTVPPSPNAKQNLGLEFSDDLDFHFNVDTGGEGFITASSFESSEKKRGLHRCAESLPSHYKKIVSATFADELFCDRKVKALPPPPSGSRSPAAGAASPRSPLSLGKKNLWNDGFDPFAAALETVTAENRRAETKNHRRVRSESPFDHHRRETQPVPIVAPKSPVQENLREPKGVEFSRRLRQVKTLAGDNGRETRETKKRKMMRFLTMRSKSVDKEEEEYRDKENTNHGSMNKLLRRLSFNRSRSSSEAEKKKKTVAMAASTGCKTRNGSTALTKMAVMQYRPKLLLCMGYGLRRRSAYR